MTTENTPMKRVFVHKYKHSHIKKRKKYRRLAKEGKVELVEKTKDGFIYHQPPQKED